MKEVLQAWFGFISISDGKISKTGYNRGTFQPTEETFDIDKDFVLYIYWVQSQKLWSKFGSHPYKKVNNKIDKI